MPNPFMYGCIILGILLALSAAGNAYQYREHTIDSVKFGTTKQLADDIGVAAKACSDGVADLADDQKKRFAGYQAQLTAETGRIKGLQHDAINAIAARPDNPADLCGSLERYLRARKAQEMPK